MLRFSFLTTTVVSFGLFVGLAGCSKKQDGWADEPSSDLYFNQVTQEEKAQTDAADAREDEVDSPCTVSASSEAYGAFVARASDTESMLEEAPFKFRVELSGSQVTKKGDTAVLGVATSDDARFVDGGEQFELAQIINRQTSLEHPDLGEVTFEVGECTAQQAFFGAIHITAAMLRAARM